MEPTISLGDITARRTDLRVRADYAKWLSIAATSSSLFAARRTFATRFPDSDLLTKAAALTSDQIPFATGAPQAFGAGVTAASVLSRATFQRVPFGVGVPLFDLFGIADSASFVGEGAPKPTYAIASAVATIAPAKVAALVVVSREFLAVLPPGGENVLDAGLTSAIVLASDRLALNPALAADPATGRPASLTFGAAITGTATSPANVSAAAAQLIADYFATVTPTKPVAVLSPAMVAWLGASGVHPQLTTAGGFLFGLPAVVSAAAGETLALFDAARTLYADDGAAVDVSQYASIDMADTPTPPTAATVLTSMYATNQAAFRVERFCSWRGAPEATAVLTVTTP